MADNEQSPGIEIEVDGKTTAIHLNSLNGRDVKDFRGEVGFSPMKAFNDPSLMDIDVIAGFLWIQRRKLKPQLTYEQVLDTVSYNNIKVSSAGVDDDDDPEA